MGNEGKGLGPNQRVILQFLKENPKMTLLCIAEHVYKKKVTLKDMEYTATSRTLRLLVKRGLIKRHEAEVTWSLKE